MKVRIDPSTAGDLREQDAYEAGFQHATIAIKPADN